MKKQMAAQADTLVEEVEVSQKETAESVIEEFNDYIPVPRHQILGREKAIADLFLKLPSGRMIKVAHKGDPIDRERIERFGKKQVVNLYVRNSDFAEVMRTLVRTAKAMSATPALQEKAIECYYQVAEAVLYELLTLPISIEGIERAAEISREISESITFTNDISKSIRMIFTLGDSVARHTLGVAVIGNWLSLHLGWDSPRTLSMITMGSLLHDIGKRELSPELLRKLRSEMSVEEIAIYESHPVRGAMLLSDFPSISPEILRIVQEHHEIPNGQGYPHRLRGEKMLPISKIVSYANVIAHDLIDPLTDKRAIDMGRIIKKIEELYKPMYGSEMTKAAMKIFIKGE